MPNHVGRLSVPCPALLPKPAPSARGRSPAARSLTPLLCFFSGASLQRLDGGVIVVAFDRPPGEKAKGGVITPFGRLRSYHGFAQDGEGGGPIRSMGSRDVVAVHGVRHLNSAGVLDGRREAQLQDACSEMAGGVRAGST